MTFYRPVYFAAGKSLVATCDRPQSYLGDLPYIVFLSHSECYVYKTTLSEVLQERLISPPERSHVVTRCCQVVTRGCQVVTRRCQVVTRCDQVYDLECIMATTSGYMSSGSSGTVSPRNKATAGNSNDSPPRFGMSHKGTRTVPGQGRT